jgi:tRNA G18 (ribose-2'-O)-methylase SpoU
MQRITDIHDSRVQEYHSLRQAQPRHSEQRIFITDGEKVTKALLESQVTVHSLFAVPEFYEQNQALIQSRVAPGACFTASYSLMEQIVGFSLHSGVMAAGIQPVHTPPEQLKPPIIVLNNIVNSDNVGSIVRICSALGIKSILTDQYTSSPWLRRAVRVSMGHICSMQVARTENLAITLAELEYYRSIIPIAAELAPGAQALHTFDFPEKFALVLGSEGYGIDPEILSLCRHILMLPMDQPGQSLNVSITAGMMLYEAFAQKARKAQKQTLE